MLKIIRSSYKNMCRAYIRICKHAHEALPPPPPIPQPNTYAHLQFVSPTFLFQVLSKTERLEDLSKIYDM